MLLFGFHNWRGESRRKYRFNVTLTDKGLPNKGGVYIFVRRHYIFWLEPLYVGKAARLKSRLLKHERWGEAWWRRGATERHIALFSTEEKRQQVEEDLVRKLKPVMNAQLVPRSKNDAPNNEKLKQRWTRRSYWKRPSPAKSA